LKNITPFKSIKNRFISQTEKWKKSSSERRKGLLYPDSRDDSFLTSSFNTPKRFMGKLVENISEKKLSIRQENKEPQKSISVKTKEISSSIKKPHDSKIYFLKKPCSKRLLRNDLKINGEKYLTNIALLYLKMHLIKVHLYFNKFLSRFNLTARKAEKKKLQGHKRDCQNLHTVANIILMNRKLQKCNDPLVMKSLNTIVKALVQSDGELLSRLFHESTHDQKTLFFIARNLISNRHS